jgi:hypothetical protein
MAMIRMVRMAAGVLYIAADPSRDLRFELGVRSSDPGVHLAIVVSKL